MCELEHLREEKCTCREAMEAWEATEACLIHGVKKMKRKLTKSELESDRKQAKETIDELEAEGFFLFTGRTFR